MLLLHGDDHKKLCQEFKELLWLVIVPLLIERSKSRGHVVGAISIVSRINNAEGKKGNVCG